MHDPSTPDAFTRGETTEQSCEHGPESTHGHLDGGVRRGVTRRRFVGLLATGSALTLAGCSELGGSDGGTTAEDVPDAVTLTTDDACEICNMIIPNHPGPSTEIFYPGEEPSGHENPARFDSTWEAFQYDFRRQDRGWERAVMYVTDYSGVDYRLFEEQGDTMLSTHPEADAFVRASEVTFVAGSEVKGAMGKDLIAFSSDEDANSFSEEHGGTLVTVDEVTPELIAQLGM